MSRRVAIHFNGEILMEEIASMVREAGFHLRITETGIMVDRVPNWLRKPVPETNVVKMPARLRKAAR